jgi:hypothetical protein
MPEVLEEDCCYQKRDGVELKRNIRQAINNQIAATDDAYIPRMT